MCLILNTIDFKNVWFQIQSISKSFNFQYGWFRKTFEFNLIFKLRLRTSHIGLWQQNSVTMWHHLWNPLWTRVPTDFATRKSNPRKPNFSVHFWTPCSGYNWCHWIHLWQKYRSQSAWGHVQNARICIWQAIGGFCIRKPASTRSAFRLCIRSNRLSWRWGIDFRLSIGSLDTRVSVFCAKTGIM